MLRGLDRTLMTGGVADRTQAEQQKYIQEQLNYGKKTSEFKKVQK